MSDSRADLPKVDDQSDGRYFILEVDRSAYEELQQSAREHDLEILWQDTGYATYGLTTSDHINAMVWAERDGVVRAWRQETDAVLTGRRWLPDATVVRSGNATMGGATVAMIAGPCSVESRDQMREVAACVKESGGGWLRGGAFKPRTSPYRFQGLGEEGLKYLREAGDEYSLPVVTEVMDTGDIEIVAEYTDVLQVGSRNAQNFSLLKALGSCGKPVLLKRGFGCFTAELLHAAEYLMAHGNANVMLCERGIRSYEHSSRFTFDINAIPVLKQATHLPVVADTAHGTGDAELVGPIAKAAVAAGCDAVMVEIHPDPAFSYSDADQALSLEGFAQLMKELGAVAEAVGRRFVGVSHA